MEYNPGLGNSPEKNMKMPKDSVPINPELATLQEDVQRKKGVVEDSINQGIQKLRTEVVFLLNTFKLPKDQEDYYYNFLKVTD